MSSRKVSWYHGTTSSHAARIFRNGFREEYTYFTLSTELADVFAWEMGMETIETDFPNLTRISIEMPYECQQKLEIYTTLQTVGADGKRPLDLGDGQEIIVNPIGIKLLNKLIRLGSVNIKRIMIHNPRKGINHGRKTE